MFTCSGTRQGLTVPHSHEAVTDAKICYGILARTEAAPPPPAPVIYGSPVNPGGPSSPRQHKYVEDLNGDVCHAMKITWGECSDLITKLISERDARKTAITAAAALAPLPPVVTVTVPPRPTYANPLLADARLPLLNSMLEGVESGYYAVQRYDSATELQFFRISRPKSGRFAWSLKIQSKHSDKLEDRLVRWPSGKWSSYTTRTAFIDELLTLVTDWMGAAIRYGENYHNCCRCNKDLTDDRSRWYNIGPDCEELRPWVIDRVNSTKGPFVG